MKIFAIHEARYMVESGKRKIHTDFCEMDTRGWPFVLSCDYIPNPLVAPHYQLKPVGMTYKIDNPNK